jgi:hypothetical protein
MPRAIVLVFIVFGLSACVARNMNDGLQGLVGQNIQAAVARLGYPDGQRTILGDTIYVWSSNHSGVLPMTTMSSTSGMVGTMPVYGSTTGTAFVPVSFNCTIQIGVDANGTIKNYQWSGNNAGCRNYASALNRN